MAHRLMIKVYWKVLPLNFLGKEKIDAEGGGGGEGERRSLFNFTTTNIRHVS